MSHMSPRLSNSEHYLLSVAVGIVFTTLPQADSGPCRFLLHLSAVLCGKLNKNITRHRLLGGTDIILNSQTSPCGES